MDNVGWSVLTAPDLADKGLPPLSAAKGSDMICTFAEK